MKFFDILTFRNTACVITMRFLRKSRCWFSIQSAKNIYHHFYNYGKIQFKTILIFHMTCYLLYFYCIVSTYCIIIIVIIVESCLSTKLIKEKKLLLFMIKAFSNWRIKNQAACITLSFHVQENEMWYLYIALFTLNIVWILMQTIMKSTLYRTIRMTLCIFMFLGKNLSTN